MPGSRGDRFLDEWRAVAETVKRPGPRRGVAVRSLLTLAMGTVSLGAVLYVVLSISQRPATSPGPAASGVSPPAHASAAPSASAFNAPVDERQAHVVASLPGVWSTGCAFPQPAATDGALWLVRERETSLVRIDTATNRVVADIQLGIGPSPQIVTADGAVWVASGNCETGSPVEPMVVKRIDPATNRVVASIPLDAPGFLIADATDVWVTIRPSRADASTRSRIRS